MFKLQKLNYCEYTILVTDYKLNRIIKKKK